MGGGEGGEVGTRSVQRSDSTNLFKEWRGGEERGKKVGGGGTYMRECVSKMGVKISFAVRAGGVTVWLSQKPKWRKTLN